MRHGVVLDPRLSDAESLSQAWCLHERGEARVERQRRLSIEREPFAIAPERPCASRDRCTIRKRAMLVVNDVERPQAMLANGGGRRLALRSAHAATQRQCTQRCGRQQL